MLRNGLQACVGQGQTSQAHQAVEVLSAGQDIPHDGHAPREVKVRQGRYLLEHDTLQHHAVPHLGDSTPAITTTTSFFAAAAAAAAGCCLRIFGVVVKTGCSVDSLHSRNVGQLELSETVQPREAAVVHGFDGVTLQA